MTEDGVTIGPDAISNDIDDALLLKRAKQGDLRAFELLVEPYLRRLLDKILTITRDREDAKDCLQNTLMLAFTRIDQFRGASRFSSWLFRIAINQALMCLRSKKRNILIFHITDDDSLPFLDPADTRPDPEQHCRDTELSTRLEEMISSLPPALRPAFELRYVHELSNEQTAVALGLSIATIKTRARRARRHIRERLMQRT
jgi:RNA polymerase sigma-70 factor, ECF subfamily